MSPTIPSARAANGCERRCQHPLVANVWTMALALDVADCRSAGCRIVLLRDGRVTE